MREFGRSVGVTAMGGLLALVLISCSSSPKPEPIPVPPQAAPPAAQAPPVQAPEAPAAPPLAKPAQATEVSFTPTKTPVPPQGGELLDELFVGGRKLSGTILYSDARQTVIDCGDRVWVVPKFGGNAEAFTKENWEKRTGTAPVATAPAPAALASSWIPRHYASEKVDCSPVLFVGTVSAEETIGKEILKDLRDHPDLLLFAPRGGRIVLHDPEKRYGWRAHSWPAPAGQKDRFLPATEDPDFVFSLPEKAGDFPDQVIFAGTSAEFKNTEGVSKSASYVPGATESIILRQGDQAEAMLARQKYAGGRPQETPYHSFAWIYALPKGISEWYAVYLDVSGKSSEMLRASTLGYAEGEVIPDYVMDIESAKGTLLGRVWVLPNLPISADGPAPRQVGIYSGKGKDFQHVAWIKVPARMSLEGPQAPPATTARLLLSAYDVNAKGPETLSVAYGTGRPTSGVTLVSRPLDPKNSDELVKIDASAAAATGLEWPVVYWLSARRTTEHDLTGGMLRRGPLLDLLPETPVRQFRFKIRNPKDAPHLVPIKFLGPKLPPPPGSGVAAGPGVASGLGGGFMADALGREAGSATSSLLQQSPAQAPLSGADSVQSNVNVNVYPVQSPAGTSGVGMSGPPSGLYLNNYGSSGTPLFAPGAPMSPAGAVDANGNYYNTQGQQLWNNQAATQQYYNQYGVPASATVPRMRVP